MRALILFAGALALTACRNNDQTDNTQNVDENLSAENIVSNDVTAIDAVTGDAANMAADVSYEDVAINADNGATGTKPVPKRPSSMPARSSAPAAATNTTTTASNATD